MFKVVPQSNLAARRLSACLGLAAVVVLAWLAWLITRNTAVAVITMLTAAATPNVFEISRLVFEVAAYPLALALFLVAAYVAFRRERWSLGLVLALTLTLVALTYAYSIGRLHAPLLLVLFAALTATRARRLPLAALLSSYVVLAILPVIVFNARHEGALTERFRRLSYLTPLREHPGELLAALGEHTVKNLDPLHGDPNERHHVKDSGGSILLMTFVLGVIGAVLAMRSRDRWWWFVAGGTLLSIIPATLTNDIHHALRLVPYPIFLIVLSISALEWLLRARPAIAALLLALGATQALWFFVVFERDGAKRTNEFDAGFRRVFADAVAQHAPLYVSHSVFMQAYWYGAQQSVDRSAYQLTWEPPSAPGGSIVVGNESPCDGCEVIRREGAFTAWRAR